MCKTHINPIFLAITKLRHNMWRLDNERVVCSLIVLMLIDGEWCEDGGGLTLKLGNIFRGRIYQRGGNSIYAKSWLVIFNGHQLGETSDPDQGKAMVEWEIIHEMTRIAGAYDLIQKRVPPLEALANWRVWKSWNVVDHKDLDGPASFTGPSLKAAKRIIES